MTSLQEPSKDPDAKNNSGRGFRRALLIGLLFGIAGICLLTMSGRFSRQIVIQSQPPGTVPWTNPRGFAGMDSCEECHAKRVAEFRGTRHFQACLSPVVDKMSADNQWNYGGVAPPDALVRFEMKQIEQQFSQTATEVTPQGERVTYSPISLVYGLGSGTDEVYFSREGERLVELPMAWLHSQNEWGLAAFDRSGHGDFARPATIRCLECHNTWMDHVAGTLNHYRPEHELLGVTCEVCHGPGQSHVSHHRSHPGDMEAVAIVQPSHLSRDRMMDLCAQCHSNALKHRGPAFQYVPGKPLDEFYRTVICRTPEEDHVANQVGYLKQSRCYQASQMTCVTCHDPHQPSELTRRGSGRSGCLQCHQIEDCHERQRLPAAVQDNCIGCHMPKHAKIQVNFVTSKEKFHAPVPRWEHQIAVYPIARDEILLKWLQTQDDDKSRQQAVNLTETLANYWLEQAESRLREYRLLSAIDAYRNALRLKPQEEVERRLLRIIDDYALTQFGMSDVLHLMAQQKYPAAEELLHRILAINPNHAQANGRLGTLYSMNGSSDLADQHWRRVLECDPNDAYGESMLGWSSFLLNHDDDALRHFQKAEELEPRYDKIQYHLALVLARMRRVSDAESHLRKLLEINPQHMEGTILLSRLLTSRGAADEAVALTRKASAFSDDIQPQVLLELADLLAANGKDAEAVATAHRALYLTGEADNPLRDEIQRRIFEWRGRTVNGK